MAARSRVMAKYAEGGAMCAVIGQDPDTVSAVCDTIPGLVLPVNFNAPAQTVISGEAAAVQAAAAELKARRCRTVILPVSGAFHTPMMQPAADALRQAASAFCYSPVTMDFYSNLTGGRLVIGDYPDYFAKHMTSPVRFVEQVAAMWGDGVAACVEFGPKKTAVALVKKNNKAIAAINVEDTASLKKAMEVLKR